MSANSLQANIFSIQEHTKQTNLQPLIHLMADFFRSN
ncbi:Uncharacterised protein [Porphyromonas cangingivalis]|nr:Uncharacterised protein [Porphyromonas cangingivalis]VEJ03929.1 Uncharacterised protein [Porphyromonas cangingivalis]